MDGKRRRGFALHHLWRIVGPGDRRLSLRFAATLDRRQRQADDKTVFDFVTTNDIIGGNSGSPAIAANGDVIGAVFDGNIHSLGGAYFFDEATNRTVIASTAAITEALRKVYRQDALVKELTDK